MNDATTTRGAVKSSWNYNVQVSDLYEDFVAACKAGSWNDAALAAEVTTSRIDRRIGRCEFWPRPPANAPQYVQDAWKAHEDAVRFAIAR